MGGLITGKKIMKIKRRKKVIGPRNNFSREYHNYDMMIRSV